MFSAATLRLFALALLVSSATVSAADPPSVVKREERALFATPQSIDFETSSSQVEPIASSPSATTASIEGTIQPDLPVELKSNLFSSTESIDTEAQLEDLASQQPSLFSAHQSLDYETSLSESEPDLPVELKSNLFASTESIDTEAQLEYLASQQPIDKDLTATSDSSVNPQQQQGGELPSKPEEPVYAPTTPIFSVIKPEKSDVDTLMEQMSIDFNFPERELERVNEALSELQFRRARVDLQLAMEHDPAGRDRLLQEGAETAKKIAVMKALRVALEAKVTKEYYRAMVDSSTEVHPVVDKPGAVTEAKGSAAASLEAEAKEIEKDVEDLIEKKFEEESKAQGPQSVVLLVVMASLLVISTMLIILRFVYVGSCLACCHSRRAADAYDQFSDQGSKELRDSIRRDRNRSVRTMVQDRKDLTPGMKSPPTAYMSVLPPTDDAVAAAAAASGFDEQPSQTIAPVQSGGVGSNMLLV